MRLRVLIKLFVLMWTISSASAWAYCYEEAGKKYRIDWTLLRAIALTESAEKPDIESRTQDIGLMGINRSWLPILSRRYGLSERDVWQPCTNVHIGAWVLADSYRIHGRNWNAVGAYNASCRKLKGRQCAAARLAYARKVYANWLRLQKKS